MGGKSGFGTPSYKKMRGWKEERNNTNEANGDARAARLDEADLFIVFVRKVVVIFGVAGVV